MCEQQTVLTRGRPGADSRVDAVVSVRARKARDRLRERDRSGWGYRAGDKRAVGTRSRRTSPPPTLLQVPGAYGAGLSPVSAGPKRQHFSPPQEMRVTMTEDLAAIDECDIVEMAPSEIEDRVNPMLLEQWETICHRGHSVEIEDLAFHLGDALETAALDQAAESERPVVRQSEAVEILTDSLAELVPAWFGEGAALEEAPHEVGDRHLEKESIVSLYESGSDRAEGTAADPEVLVDGWENKKRVVLPYLGAVVPMVEMLMASDGNAGAVGSTDAV